MSNMCKRNSQFRTKATFVIFHLQTTSHIKYICMSMKHSNIKFHTSEVSGLLVICMKAESWGRNSHGRHVVTSPPSVRSTLVCAHVHHDVITCSETLKSIPIWVASNGITFTRSSTNIRHNLQGHPPLTRARARTHARTHTHKEIGSTATSQAYAQ